MTHSLFNGLSFQIGAKSRIGLIGRNGCGKSTLLKIVMGVISPDEGSVYRAPGLRINYLSQEPRITPHLTLEEEMRSVFTAINALEREEAELLRQLNEPSDASEESSSESENRHLALATRLNRVHAELERLDAANREARISRILKGLGFAAADHQRKTGEFSGGWKMRINLAKVLLEGAEVLLLDEPTNHLDLEACEWLESFLKEYPGGLVLVSHDRRFLDQVATEIAELERDGLKVRSGNYTAHLALKAAEMEQLAAAYNRQQKELSKQTAFVERFRASATRSTQAKSREKQLAKVERIALPQQDNRRLAFRFPAPQASGRQVFTLRDVRKAFGDKLLFQSLNADFERGRRIFLLGANGTGKTTLLRLILGLETPDAGEIRQGHNVKPGYFSQNQLETLDPDKSVMDTLQEIAPMLTNTELRTLLGCFLFSGEQVFKPVSVLSGGEKSKLALARLMLSGPNVLLLDEPTNHMDIPSKDVMAEALLDYEGSILCISHDRHFIQELATDIWELYDGHLLTYGGDYEYYLFKRNQMRAGVQAIREAALNPRRALKTETVPEPTAAASPLQARKELEKQLRKVERDILALEEEIAGLQAKLLDPALQQDYQQLHELSISVERKQQALSQLNDAWSELAEALS